MSSPVLSISGLTVAYGDRPAVEDLDLVVGRGEIVAVVGESGSGKSTTASAVLGLLARGGAITAGKVEIDGRDVTRFSERRFRDVRGKVVGLVPQDPMVALNPTLRIGPQVAEAVRRRGDVPKRSVDAEVVAALEAAGLVPQPLGGREVPPDAVQRARQYPHELSGGMRQRVLIAIALAGNPQLVIADEPTSALDVTVQKRILDHLEHLVRERGISLLIITHDLGVAADRADRLVVMQGGRVVEQGTPHDVLVAPREEYTRRLTAAAPGLSSHGRISPRHREVPPAPELLRIEGVTKDFALPRGSAQPTLRALDDVSLAVHAGQTLAVVGESGSGKTTALRIALGLEQPTHGKVFFEGTDITGHSWRQTRPLRRRFQLVHQNPFSSLDPRFTVGQSITEPLVSFGIGDRVSRKARAVELLDQVALPQAFLSRRPAELSGGQRQRVAIARALALEPDLVFLDEPVSALDVSVQEQILQLLRRLQDELGVGYLFISHDLAVVAQVAHRVAVLRRGELVEHGTAAEVLENPQSEYTRELLAAVPGRKVLK